MRELKAFQDTFGTLIRRHKRPPIADDFTAAVALTLDLFLAANGLPEHVHCERATHRRRGATRPDISVLSGSHLVATVECKTDFGWKRKTWKADCETRSQDLKSTFPDCTTFLCVLMDKNFDATELISSPLFNKEWYCLSRMPAARLSNPILDSDIFTPIEPMFISVLECVKALAPGQPTLLV